jgi:hypothetical protein
MNVTVRDGDLPDLRCPRVCCLEGLKKLIAIAVIRAEVRYQDLQNKNRGKEYSSPVFSYNEGTFIGYIIYIVRTVYTTKYLKEQQNRH